MKEQHIQQIIIEHAEYVIPQHFLAQIATGVLVAVLGAVAVHFVKKWLRKRKL